MSQNSPAAGLRYPDPDKSQSVQGLRLDGAAHFRFTRCMTIARPSTGAHGTPCRRFPRRVIAALLRGLGDVFRHAELPGYMQLPWTTRCYINARALCGYIASRQFGRLSLWLTAWLLGTYLLIWQYDLYGPIAAMPPLLALLWVLPCFAHARRKAIAELLQQRWPG